MAGKKDGKFPNWRAGRFPWPWLSRACPPTMPMRTGWEVWGRRAAEGRVRKWRRGRVWVIGVSGVGWGRFSLLVLRSGPVGLTTRALKRGLLLAVARSAKLGGSIPFRTIVCIYGRVRAGSGAAGAPRNSPSELRSSSTSGQWIP